MSAPPTHPRSERWSLPYWLLFYSSGVLFAALMLTARARESERLSERYARNADEISRLTQDVEHLQRLESAYLNDAGFLSRTAQRELQLPLPGQQQVELPEPSAVEVEELEDIPSRTTAVAPLIPLWMRPLAEEATLRSRAWQLLACLSLAATFCLHPWPMRGVWQRLETVARKGIRWRYRAAAELPNSGDVSTQ